jgi:hypothetical protein
MPIPLLPRTVYTTCRVPCASYPIPHISYLTLRISCLLHTSYTSHCVSHNGHRMSASHWHVRTDALHLMPPAYPHCLVPCILSHCLVRLMLHACHGSPLCSQSSPSPMRLLYFRPAPCAPDSILLILCLLAFLRLCFHFLCLNVRAGDVQQP